MSVTIVHPRYLTHLGHEILHTVSDRRGEGVHGPVPVRPDGDAPVASPPLRNITLLHRSMTGLLGPPTPGVHTWVDLEWGRGCRKVLYTSLLMHYDYCTFFRRRPL